MNRLMRMKMPAFFFLLAVAAWYAIAGIFGTHGLWGDALRDAIRGHEFIWGVVYFCVMGHLTITAMSISFHRVHTHKAARLHPALDTLFQGWLWAITSMSKLDWVSVHVYHHAHSDKPTDAHSPVQNGIWHALFLGVFDYSRAKNNPEVLKIRSRLPENAIEKFFDRNLFLGPVLLSSVLMVAFGPGMGLLLSVMNFMVSPVFAVGGVNALAHWWGYRNYSYSDNSRNLGFLLPLNFVICGELDHNNHHRYPLSANFAHRRFEFDVGFQYLRLFQLLGLAKIFHVQRWRRISELTAAVTS